MRELMIIDGHLDMAYNALFYRRDLTRSIYTLREREDSRVGLVRPSAFRKKKLMRKGQRIL